MYRIGQCSQVVSEQSSNASRVAHMHMLCACEYAREKVKRFIHVCACVYMYDVCIQASVHKYQVISN